MKNSLIVDSGFFIALANAKDRDHILAKRLLPKIQGRPWISTWPVITEVAYFLSEVSQNSYKNGC